MRSSTISRKGERVLKGTDKKEKKETGIEKGQGERKDPPPGFHSETDLDSDLSPLIITGGRLFLFWAVLFRWKNREVRVSASMLCCQSPFFADGIFAFVVLNSQTKDP